MKNTQEEIKKVSEIEFQNICGNFVKQEVLACVSCEMEYILNKSWEDSNAPYSWEDVENFYIYRVETIDKKDFLPLTYEKLERFRGYEEEFTQEQLRIYQEKIEDLKILFEDELDRLAPLQDEEREELEKAVEKIEEHLNYLENLEAEPQEIYEWWLVSTWLAKKLKEKGHPVIINRYGASLWGRCCTGQAILIDNVIRRLVMEYRHIKPIANR